MADLWNTVQQFAMTRVMEIVSLCLYVSSKI
jgi:hypothetical protein